MLKETSPALAVRNWKATHSMILIIDASRRFRDSVAAFLRGHGYDVVCVPDGEAALRWLGTSQPEVILLDLDLDLVTPGMSGLTFLRNLRSDERWAALPVVVLSTGSDGPQGVEAKGLGARACLVKGNFSLTELVHQVRIFSPARDHQSA
jgi:DNA-binding response OmpR family regulator